MRRIPDWLALLLAALVAVILLRQRYDELGYAFTWLLSYPIITLTVALLAAISWNLVGNGMGMNALFWHHNRFIQFLSGLMVGSLAGMLLHVRYLVPGELAPQWFLDRFQESPSLLFWMHDHPSLYALGQYLLLLFPLVVLLLVIPVASDLKHRWPLAAGAFGAVFLFMLASFVLDEVGALSPQLQARTLVSDAAVRRSLAKGERDVSPPAGVKTQADASEADLQEQRLPHRLLFAMAIILLFFLLFPFVFEWVPGWRPLPPILTLLTLLCLVNGAVGYMHVQTRNPYLPYLIFVGIVVWGFIANRDSFKNRFPGLESIYQKRRALEPPSFNSAGVSACEMLTAASIRWQSKLPMSKAPSKPPLIILAVSGGGSRAAVFTCSILEELRRCVPLLADQIRLISGASGGMVGAGFYVAQEAARLDSDNPPQLPNGIEPQVQCRDENGQPIILHAPLGACIQPRSSIARSFDDASL